MYELGVTSLLQLAPSRTILVGFSTGDIFEVPEKFFVDKVAETASAHPKKGMPASKACAEELVLKEPFFSCTDHGGAPSVLMQVKARTENKYGVEKNVKTVESPVKVVRAGPTVAASSASYELNH